MDQLDLSLAQLRQIVASGEIIGQGNCGIVYKLDDSTLFKFKYKKFIDCFEIINNKVMVRQLSMSKMEDEIRLQKEIASMLHLDLGNSEQHIVNAGNRQGKIKYSQLTKGLVCCDDYCIGYLLHYHKDMVPLYDYLQSNLLTVGQYEYVSMQMKRAFQELIANNIYLYDMTTHNILYNPVTSEIKLIDFEDSLYCTGAKVPHKENDMLRSLKLNMLYLSEHNENESNLIDLL